MSAAAYNRGSKIVRRDADERARAAIPRSDREAAKDESARLRERILQLERELARARRCIAELRRSKEARLSDARAEQASSQAAIQILTRVAFRQGGAK
jgi:hypothetical protein